MHGAWRHLKTCGAVTCLWLLVGLAQSQQAPPPGDPEPPKAPAPTTPSEPAKTEPAKADPLPEVTPAPSRSGSPATRATVDAAPPVPPAIQEKPVVKPPAGDYGYEFLASPNFDRRPKRTKVDTIVLHHTVIPDLARTAFAFMSPRTQVSAHFIVERDGKVLQMVRVADRAWHAGVSLDPRWRANVNDFSVGIEIVNTGSGRQKFPPAQVKAVKKLVRDIMRQFKVKQIVSHRYVAEPQGRKDDPKNYPWDSLRDLKVPLYRDGKPIGPPMPPEMIARVVAERKAKEESALARAKAQSKKGKAAARSSRKSKGSSKPQ